MTMPMVDYNPNAATVDHIVPLSLGGTHTIENVRCVCHLCNSLRGNRPMTDGQVAWIRKTNTGASSLPKSDLKSIRTPHRIELPTEYPNMVVLLGSVSLSRSC